VLNVKKLKFVMKTSEYKYFNFPFYEFNKAQSAVIPHITRDINLVVSFPTATGKTAIAEAAFGYYLQTMQNSKCIYASPYRSLSMQKQSDWMEDLQLSRYGIVINTGDHLADTSEFEAARLIILTTESFDSKTRNKQQYSWLKKVICVVIDEAHLLGMKGRGDSVEAVLMRFTELNSAARIILLSATMSNAEELSAWLKMLNGKETLKVTSRWRPTRIRTQFHTFDEYDKESWANRIKMTVELIQSIPDSEKVIVFVHSKRLGRELAALIRRAGVACAFHNADLSHSKRKQIEKAFDDPLSGLNVIVSTSTLASGVNIGVLFLTFCAALLL